MTACSAAGRRPARGFGPAIAWRLPPAMRRSRPLMCAMAGNTSVTRCRPGLKIRHSTASAAASMPSDTRWQFNPESLDKLSPAIRRVQLQNGLLPDYGENFNPLLRCIVRRTRAYLEATINPATGGYFLPKVTVKLFGEDNEGALVLGGYLREAYQEAESFSQLLQQRVQRCGILQDAAVATPRQFDGSRSPHRRPSCWAKSPTPRMMRTRMMPKRRCLPRSDDRRRGSATSRTSPMRNWHRWSAASSCCARWQQRSKARCADWLSAWHPSWRHPRLARSGLHPVLAVLRHRPLGR